MSSEEKDIVLDKLKQVVEAIKNPKQYYFKWLNQIKEYIEDLESKVEDLTADKEHLEEELRNLKQDLEDNYRPIPISEQVGISDRDFI